MVSGGTGSVKKNVQAQSIFGTITSFLKFIGQPTFQLLLVTGYLLLLTFTLVGKLTIKIVASILYLVSGIGNTTLSFTAKILIRNTQLVTQKLSSFISPITYHLSPITFPKPFLRFLLSKKLFFLLFAVCCLLFAVYNFYFLILKDLPSPNQLITRQPILTTKIYDRNGQLLYKIYRNQNRTLVKLQDIPLSLQQATIAIEDKDFYQHQGFSPKGIARSLYRNIIYGSQTGGSTITQQLVKNTLLTPEKTLRRKIKEIVLALLVEARFSKEEILQMYLNEVPYGSVAYGVEEAAQTYFGKSVKDINFAEVALLAGLPAAPTRYSPFGAHPELAKVRQKQVLAKMAEEGYITNEQKLEIGNWKLEIAKPKAEIKAPHFVMYIKDLLVKEYGQSLVEEGGLEVITSLDLEIQEMAQGIVSGELRQLRQLNISNGAALVTNPQTGEILAMVGSKDYFDSQSEGNFNVTLASRQPGSSIKPVNYAVALQNGFTPATLIPDTPISYQIPGQPPYSPKNYDGRFHGNTTLRIALASSYNVPAVKVLSALGVERMIEQGTQMGISTWDNPSNYGLSLTLGGGEVKMVDMAVVYSTLANLGKRVDLNPILGVKDYQGKILEELPQFPRSPLSPQSTRVLPPTVAYLLTDILSDNVARTPAFGPNSLLNIPGHKVAVKTGTTQNLRDNWTIGYTPDFLVATWVGNNDNTPMSWVASGVIGASPIWNKIMTNLLADKPPQDFPKPEDLKEITICQLTNSLNCKECPNPKVELFLPGTEPKYACNEEIIQKILSPSQPSSPSPRLGP